MLINKKRSWKMIIIILYFPQGSYKNIRIDSRSTQDMEKCHVHNKKIEIHFFIKRSTNIAFNNKSSINNCINTIIIYDCILIFFIFFYKYRTAEIKSSVAAVINILFTWIWIQEIDFRKKKSNRKTINKMPSSAMKKELNTLRNMKNKKNKNEINSNFLSSPK